IENSSNTTPGTATRRHHDTVFYVEPNPTQDRLRLRTESELTSGWVEIWNVAGKLIERKYYSDKTSLDGMEFDLSEWSSGIYLVRVGHGGGISTLKVLKN